MKRLFTQHPRDVNMTYFQHLRHALSVGSKAASSGLACIIHGIFPFIFKQTLSNTVNKLTEDFASANKRFPQQQKKVR